MSTIRFEDHIGLVHLQAKKGFKWADAVKSGLTYEDVFQEASAAFVVAAERFDESMGMTFSAYYTQVAFSFFRKAIGVMTGVKNLNTSQRKEIEDHKAESERRAAAGLPPVRDCIFGLSVTNFSEFGEGNESAEGFESSINSGAQSPEEIVEFREIVEESLSNISPVASLIIEWLINPPEALKRELELQAEHAKKMLEGGYTHLTKKYSRGLCVERVSQFLSMIGAATKAELMIAEKEILSASKKIEKASGYGS